MAIRFLWFDLDNTLYPASSGFLDALDARINLYLEHKYGVPADRAASERHRLYITYGATIMGLSRERTVDYDDYMDFVYRADPADYFPPVPALKEALDSVSLPKIILSNSCRAHAEKVLAYLGIKDCFQGIFCMEKDLVAKPLPEAYLRTAQKTGFAIGESLLIDDADRNLAAAAALGMKTLKVSENGEGNGFDCVRSALEATRLARTGGLPGW